jgi:deoxyribonuclease V
MTTIPKAWLYPKDLTEAILVQRELANRVVTQDRWTSINTIAGIDVSNTLAQPDRIYTAAVMLERHSMLIKESSMQTSIQEFPYISGFLGFREAPGLVETIRSLSRQPDLLMVDGHGISHPRGLGIASHIGVLLDVPTIGVAKSILVGKIEGTLGSETGDTAPLVWKGQQIAIAVRTKQRCNPLFISPGHRVTLYTALELVLECLRGYRLPEPTRQAHLAANRKRQEYL